MQLIFEKTSPGRKAASLPECDVPVKKILAKKFLRKELDLPELSEIDVIRHYTQLSKRNFGVDDGFYPLGSCTMKYNPKINEDTSRLPGFNVHPLAPMEMAQGCLQMMFELQEYLNEITGMDTCTLQPAAGSHGELAGVMVIKNYFMFKGEKRSKIIIPDSAHGTNPASVSMCGFETQEIKSNSEGLIDIEELKKIVDKDTAGLMLTNPNTLGLFDKNIKKIAKILHDAGALFYCDGANMNAFLGIAKVGDMGFDIVHLNLHKTFSTPHGCGGPGSGPICVKKDLNDYLPKPIVVKKNNAYYLEYKHQKSIGKMRAFWGNFGVMVKAYTYIRALGATGLKAVAENAVLNANYMMNKLKPHFDLPYNKTCMHEFVLSDKGLPNEITTTDIAKRLLDYGFHAPTIYFPLIVHGAIMIEPTETEPKEMLDKFIDTMIKIKKEAQEQPELVKGAPNNLPVKRLDAVKAAREPDLKWEN